MDMNVSIRFEAVKQMGVTSGAIGSSGAKAEISWLLGFLDSRIHEFRGISRIDFAVALITT